MILATLGYNAMAQVKATMKEEMRSNSKGSFSCIVMDFPATSYDKVKDSWNSFIKEYKGKTDYTKKDKEFFTDDASIKDMSENTVDIYARLTDREDKGSEFAVWFNLGVNYLSQKDFPKQYDVAQKLLEKFSKKLSADVLEDQLKEEEKKMKKIEDELKDFEKEESKRKSDIEDYKATIKKMEDNIKKAEDDIKKAIENQGTKKTELSDQKKKVTEVENALKSYKSK